MRLRKRLLVVMFSLVAVGVGTPATDAGAGTTARPVDPASSAAYARSGLGAAPRKAGATVTVMSFNVCGGVCRRGEVDRTASFAARTALRRKADVVLLQELCYSQFRKVRSLLAAEGFSARFAAQTHSPACARDDRRHGTGFGVAVLVRGRATGTVVRHLPTRAGFEPRLMLGTTATVGGRRTFVAVVHLSPTRRAGLDRELTVLAGELNRRTRGPVIVGGDFNAMPDHAQMGRFYSAAAKGRGRFTELDEMRGGVASRGGAPTFDLYHRKIDYVFASRRWFDRPSAAGIATPMSDHRVYVGSFRTLRN